MNEAIASDFRADLHCHTTCSDGTFTEEEIIKHAKECGLKGLSITDHDTIQAYTKAIPCAKEVGIELISGVEFSTTHLGENVHLLGYGFNLKDKGIEDLCLRHSRRRTDRNLKILELLKCQDIEITESDLAALSEQNNTSVGRPHIALAMIKKGYVASVDEAFKKYLGENKPCYAKGIEISAEETMSIIKGAGGLVVIAHPHLIREPKVLHGLLNMDFDGIECYYAQFPRYRAERWLKIAQEKKWLITGGSDFHGLVKPNITLGCSWVPETTFQQLQQKYHLSNQQ